MFSKTVSVSKLVDELQSCNNFSLSRIYVYIIPKSLSRDKFNRQTASVCGLLAITDGGKKLAYNYGKISEVFGAPISIIINDSPKRKVHPNLQCEVLEITAFKSSFKNKDGKEIEYYPNVIIPACGELGKKFLTSMNEFNSKPNESHVVDEDGYEFV